MSYIYSTDAAIDCSKENIVDVIVKNCRKFKDQTAFIDSETGNVLTFQGLLEKSIKISQILERKFHYKLDDVVALLLENTSDFWTIVLGCLFSGIAVHLFNPNSTSYELENLITRSKPRLIFASDLSLVRALETKRQFDFVENVVKTGKPEAQNDFFYLDALVDAEVIDEAFEPLEVDMESQVAMIMNSSGTSGLPKSVELTYRNLTTILGNAWHPNCLYKTPKDTTVSFCPFYHISGTIVSLLTMISGMVSVIMPKFHGKKYLELIDDHRATLLVMVPPIADFLVQSPLVADFKLDSVDDVVCGAAPLATEIQNVLSKRLNVKVRQMYGLTEVTGITTLTPVTGTSKIGAVGKVVPGIVAKISPVKTEVPETIGSYTLGEICFKSPAVMKGYLHNKTATDDIIDDEGFLHTGDLGYCDNEGYFYVIDRLKDLIKHKGFQVPPAELEDLLKSNPEIHDAGVVGKPNRRTGENPVAFIVLRPGSEMTEDEVKKFISDRLSREKQLHEVHFVEALPKNSTGKTMRRQLRERLAMATEDDNNKIV
ncbi:PREDICTED: 4-coumarate--CoA ligase 1-like [Nicrophorus vespilloides]|uniref:Luciferin 4-monooxygenase n=1 Tax=Nicrophorus vespilloides TaxID=110193 RepID=A0ABM1M3X5_NICVS|nr:PREDICTED: 4-coumarate--CoA ligase 1-like [Nicrophorus vespilloides]